MKLINSILQYTLRVVTTLLVALLLVMCENDCDCTNPPSADPPPYVNEDGEDAYPGDDKKDIPIKRPPTSDEMKKIRPRVGYLLDVQINRPSTLNSKVSSVPNTASSNEEIELLDE